MMRYNKKRNGQRQPTVPVYTRLLDNIKQSHNQKSEDVHLFLADLNSEGFTVKRNPHLHVSFQPPALIRRGLIALSAIALLRVKPHSPHLSNQQPPVRKQVLFKFSRSQR
jgi:hypothetical protein